MLEIFRDISLKQGDYPKGLEGLTFDLYLGHIAERDLGRDHLTPNDHTWFSVYRFFLVTDPPLERVSPEEVRKVLDEKEVYKVAILNALGNVRNRKWFYLDWDDKLDEVQNWIDEQDDKIYGALLIDCGNGGRITPTVGKIPLLYVEGLLPVFYPDADYKTKFLLPTS